MQTVYSSKYQLILGPKHKLELYCRSDHEYRILRQNLFERYASGTAAPTETPIVPLAGRAHGCECILTPFRLHRN